MAVVCNFTPVVRADYRLGVPGGGICQERLNTDAEAYGGGNVGNAGRRGGDRRVDARPAVLADLKVPPFATVILEHVGTGK